MGNCRRVGLVQLENDTCLREGRKGCTSWSMELGEKERPEEGKRKAMLYDESKNCWELEKKQQCYTGLPHHLHHSLVLTGRLLLIIIIVYKKAADQYCTKVISAQ